MIYVRFRAKKGWPGCFYMSVGGLRQRKAGSKWRTRIALCEFLGVRRATRRGATSRIAVPSDLYMSAWGLGSYGLSTVSMSTWGHVYMSERGVILIMTW